MGTVRKPEQKKLARELRGQGESLRSIAERCQISVSTAKRWTDDITLTPLQKEKIEKRVQEARHRAGLKTAPILHSVNRLFYETRVENDRQEAEQEWDALKSDPSFMFGLALYIGEGDKTGSRIGMTNSDPLVLKAALRFFHSLGCDPSGIRVQVILHEGEDPEKALHFWASELDIPREQFNKVTPSKKSGGSRATKLPNGTVNIRFHSASLKRKVDRWMELALGA